MRKVLVGNGCLELLTRALVGGKYRCCFHGRNLLRTGDRRFGVRQRKVDWGHEGEVIVGGGY